MLYTQTTIIAVYVLQFTSPPPNSYNAFKFQLQHGNLNQQLSATSHLLCATCAGNHSILYSELHSPNGDCVTYTLLCRSDHIDPNQSHLGGENSSLPYQYVQCSQLHALHRPHRWSGQLVSLRRSEGAVQRLPARALWHLSWSHPVHGL